MTPLKQFICDKCHDLIEKPEDGWFEWIQAGDGIAHSFKIVHHTQRCHFHDGKDGQSDNHLQYFVGEHGLGRLLWIVSPDSGAREQKRAYVRDINEWLEVLKRFTVPLYEEARQYFGQAEEDDLLDAYHTVSLGRLAQIIERFSEDEQAIQDARVYAYRYSDDGQILSALLEKQSTERLRDLMEIAEHRVGRLVSDDIDPRHYVQHILLTLALTDPKTENQRRKALLAEMKGKA